MLNDETAYLLHDAMRGAQETAGMLQDGLNEFIQLWHGVDDAERDIAIIRFEADNMADREAARKHRRPAVYEQRRQLLRLKRLALLYGSFRGLAQLEEDYYEMVRRLIN